MRTQERPHAALAGRSSIPMSPCRLHPTFKSQVRALGNFLAFDSAIFSPSRHPSKLAPEE